MELFDDKMLKKVHYCYLFFPKEYLTKADISEKTNPAVFTSIFKLKLGGVG